MAILSKQVLSDSGTEWNKLSAPIEAAGWFGRTPGLHTLSFTVRNFVGRIYVLATLENDPALADRNQGWFPIYIGGDTVPWVEFPTAADKASRPPLTTSKHGYQTTGTFCETFFGNFTYLKVGFDRDYLTTKPVTADTIAVGKVEQVLLNF